MGVRLNALAWASMTTARPEKDNLLICSMFRNVVPF
jgi:hypothetical protein